MPSRGGINTKPRDEPSLHKTLFDLKQQVEFLATTGAENYTDFDSTTAAGQAVYITTGGNTELADASALATSFVMGLAGETVTAGSNGYFITDGQISLDDWTDVTGSTTLVPGATYYLDTTAGMLTTTAPTTPGETVVAVGKALTALTLDIEIAQPILL